MQEYSIPQFLDNPPQVFWLELDELAPFIGCFGAGLLIRKVSEQTIFFTISMLVGVLLSWLYMRYKRGNLQGALKHILYSSGVFALNKRFNNGLLKEFTN
jgi:conjugal transfer pilus assembly protein TraL